MSVYPGFVKPVEESGWQLLVTAQERTKPDARIVDAKEGARRGRKENLIIAGVLLTSIRN